MLINTITPFLSFANISVFNAGDETEAALNPDPLGQRAHYIIHFVLEGQGTYTNYNPITNTKTELKPNTVFAIYKYDSVFYQSDPANPLHYCWIGFDGEESEKLLEYIGFSPNNLTFECNSPKKLYSAFLRLFETWKKKDKYRLLSEFFNLISVLRECNTTKQKYAHESQNDLYVRVENYIKMHVMDNIKVSDIANFVHLDRCYFSKIFKEHFKVSPYAYISRQRLYRAEILLRTTNYSVQKIASLLNFSDIYAFSAAFKKRYGLSPMQFKKTLT